MSTFRDGAFTQRSAIVRAGLRPVKRLRPASGSSRETAPAASPGRTGRTWILAAALLVSWIVPSIGSASEEALKVDLFRDAPIRYRPDSTVAPGVQDLMVADHGRLVSRSLALPAAEAPVRITLHLSIRPVPKDERTVHDRWDRAGNIRLRLPGLPDLEILRFMTSYGGRTDHAADVTPLAPLLQGRRTVSAFIDTWVDPAWTVDASLWYEPDSTAERSSWVAPIYYTDGMTAKNAPDGEQVVVEVPDGLRRVVLMYYSTGHCTDGIDADEFISKANVISVDGSAVHRFHPWRADCRQFRDRNPYTTRWTDGTWSSDYSRSGWCPGTEVLPYEIDLTDHLVPGGHTVRFRVLNMRPEDEKGHFGYWRISGYLVGWDHEPMLWRN